MEVDYTDPTAPWNQHEAESVTQTKKVMLGITKVMDLTTWDTETDEDEGHEVAVARRDADWIQAYEDNELNLTELLKLLSDLAGCRIKELERDCQNLSIHLPVRRMKYKKLLHWRRVAEACKGWEIEEIEVDDV